MAHGESDFHTLNEGFHILRMTEVVGVDERVVEGVSGPEPDLAFALRPQQNRNGRPDIPVVDRLKHLPVVGLSQPVCLPQLCA